MPVRLLGRAGDLVLENLPQFGACCCRVSSSKACIAGSKLRQCSAGRIQQFRVKDAGFPAQTTEQFARCVGVGVFDGDDGVGRCDAGDSQGALYQLFPTILVVMPAQQGHGQDQHRSGR